MPNLIGLPENVCHFAPRCPYALDVCVAQSPWLYEYEEGHVVRCFRYIPETAHLWADSPAAVAVGD